MGRGLAGPPQWTERSALDPNHKPQCATSPSSTVTKSWGASPQERFVVSADGRKIRKLTLEEVARLQGFPEGWFEPARAAGVAEGNLVGLAGNAVPPPVGAAVYNALAQVTPGRRVIELFAGAGGLALGAGAAGFDVLALVDLWRPSCTILGAHWGARARCMNVDDIDFAAMRGGFDVLSGGPPCQPFSSGGKRAGTDDPRDRCTALPLMLRAAQPEAFVFEEALEIYNHEGGAYFARLRDAFHRAGYAIAALVLNAHDFGVPQIRCRAYVAGFRSSSPTAWTHAVLAQAEPGAGGIVADVLEADPDEPWASWKHGCRRPPTPRNRCPSRAIYVDPR